MHHRLDSQLDEALKQIDVEGCQSAGGRIEYVGMFGMPSCIMPFKDAGKICQDSSECEGGCFVHLSNDDPMPQPGEARHGKCAANNSSYGCWWQVKEGIVQQGICMD